MNLKFDGVVKKLDMLLTLARPMNLRLSLVSSCLFFFVLDEEILLDIRKPSPGPIPLLKWLT